MASTPEAKAKKYLRDHFLIPSGCYYTMTVTGGFGKSGIPDYTGCHKGRYFGIEVKADTEPTALQLHNLELIEQAGGFACIFRRRSNGTLEGVEQLVAFFGEL